MLFLFFPTFIAHIMHMYNHVITVASSAQRKKIQIKPQVLSVLLEKEMEQMNTFRSSAWQIKDRVFTILLGQNLWSLKEYVQPNETVLPSQTRRVRLNIVLNFRETSRHIWCFYLAYLEDTLCLNTGRQPVDITYMCTVGCINSSVVIKMENSSSLFIDCWIF